MSSSSTMAGESSKRSNLIDITYQQLHSLLSGQLEGTSLEQLADILKPRVSHIRNVVQPFGKPNDASKKKVDSGSVALRDGVIIRVEPADKEFVFAISDRFDIDQVDALVLLRSFLYNEGLPATAGTSSETTLVQDLVEAITPFYYAERLYVLRALIPLFRASENAGDPVHELARDVLPVVLPAPKPFANMIIDEYKRKLAAPLPDKLAEDAKRSAAWAKQNAKEQLVLLEVIFWTMWSYAPCDGELVPKLYEVAFGSKLGSVQENSIWLLDNEGVQLQQDTAALWILITVEILELERAAEPDAIELAMDPEDKSIYWSDPKALRHIHELVTSQGDSHYACTYMAWAFILSRLLNAAGSATEIPEEYSTFAQSLVRDREPTPTLMVNTCLDPDIGLFFLMKQLLTNSPLFVTVVAWRAASHITDPNAVAYRSVLKGLVVATVELVPVELIPDLDTFVEVWTALYGRSESSVISGISRQFWDFDYTGSPARRALLDTARSRFPVQPRPLIRLLRSMCGTGLLDTDPLSGGQQPIDASLEEERHYCSQHAFFYMHNLISYTQVLPLSACGGAHGLYEKMPERFAGPAPQGIAYTNLRPIRLPGGSILPTRSTGRLLSADGGEMIVVSWEHKHSGWKVLLEILTDYVSRRQQRGTGVYQNNTQRGTQQITALRLTDIGVEMDPAGDEDLVCDILDLFRSLVKDNDQVAEHILQALESGDPVVAHSLREEQPPDLVQLTTLILEEALMRSASPRAPTKSSLITSALSVLTTLLGIPRYSTRVWLYIRSTASLFGSDKSVGVTSAVLASERLTGQYTMTLALLHLVQQLFSEASSTLLLESQSQPKLLQIKEEVLLRAVRFVHSEVWVEFTGWKYAQLGDRFEIGRRLAAFYVMVLTHSSPTLPGIPFETLSKAVAEAFVFKATTSTITPIVYSLTTAGGILGALHGSRRFGDARRLIHQMESHLVLTRTLLQIKQNTGTSTDPCLLEQALCTRVAGSQTAFESATTKADPVDALASYIKERTMGSLVPVESMRVLSALCSSLSQSQGTSPTIIGHLSDPEAVVKSLVRIIQHPYDDPQLRTAVWNFITLAVDKEPALAKLFVTGHFRTPLPKALPSSDKGKGKEKDTPEELTSTALSAIQVATDMLPEWRGLWESNPQLLASLVRFLDVVWQHGHEHWALLESIREKYSLFEQLAEIVGEEFGPTPDCRTSSFVDIEHESRSDMHEPVAHHAYRTAVKAHALHILAVDIRMHQQSQSDKKASLAKPASYKAIEGILKSDDEFDELLSEGAASAYDPSVHDEFADLTKEAFPGFTLDQLRVQEPVVEREYGDDFGFSTALLQFRLEKYVLFGGLARAEELMKRLTSINLTLSMATVQTSLTESWQYLLLQTVPYLRGDAQARPILMSLAAHVSGELAVERRSGEMMSTIHFARLNLLLALLEVAWFSTTDKLDEIIHFISLAENVRGVVLSAVQPPMKSILGQITVPIHRPLLQVVYFCAHHGLSLSRRPKLINSDQRLRIAALLETALNLVVDSLRHSFDAARLRLDPELDLDLSLLVSVFAECTHPALNRSPTLWLARLQETDAVRASLELFSCMDLAGVSDITLLRTRKTPLYAPHVLAFHVALARVPSAAERLASEGVLPAYASCALSPAIRVGGIDATIPELLAERSPAHKVYCGMLGVIAGVVTALGRHGTHFGADACGLVQLFGDQLHRALGWTIDAPLTLPLLEELEVTAALFYALAQHAPNARLGDEENPVRQVLRFFSTDALLLLQQLNYALTHPNQLASVFEPITPDEKARFDADARASAAAAGGELNPMRRPFLAGLVHRLFRISGIVLCTLVNVSSGETVLIGEPEEWPVGEALIVPHTKVVLGEPASLGTLLELGNCALDTLRHLVDRPASQALTPASAGVTPADKPLDVKDAVRETRRTLEAMLLYSATQLAMWLSKPEFERTSGEGDDESMSDIAPASASANMSLLGGGSLSASVDAAKERKGRRQSGMTLAERLRRGMTGEMAADMLGLLSKAKSVVEKSGKVLGKESGEESVDLTDVLVRFVQERVAGA